MANEPATQTTLDPKALASLMIKGDLSGFNEEQRVEYYKYRCAELGLDPATQPFSLLSLQGKVVLYANKSCTEQLRQIHGISVTSSKVDVGQDVVIVQVTGQDKTGRIDTGIGVVTIKGLLGDQYCNAIMKAETKAKRRLTLSLSGLAVMDETEVETVAGATKLEVPNLEMKRAVDPREETARQWATSGVFTTDELAGLREAFNKGEPRLTEVFDKFASVYAKRLQEKGA